MKHLKRHIRLVSIGVFVVLFSSVLRAQRTGHGDKELYESKMEELKSEKVAYFTNKMNLSAETAQKFWPLYNECEEKKMSLHKQFRDLMKGMHKDESGKWDMEDADYLKLADAMVDVKLKQAQLQKDYLQKYKAVLTPEQLVKFYRADEQFGRDMLKRYQGRSRSESKEKESKK